MNLRDVRLDATGHWFLEVSALLAVFPWLDQILNNARPFNWGLLSWCAVAVMILSAVGLVLLRGGE